MSNAQEKPRTAVATVSVDVNNPVSLYLDTAVFAQINRIANMMTQSGLAPVHLRSDEKYNRVADCILVVNQALRWNSDPFAVAQHTFVTKGKLGYEGKLIAAMVNASPKLKENLDYEYSGEGMERQVVVTGQFKGSERVRTVSGTVKDWKTDNEFWKKNPDQMLAYRGAREWARRHMPEVLLGVNSEEEITPRGLVDITPREGASALSEALSRTPVAQPDDLRVVDGEVVDADGVIAEGDEAEASKLDKLLAGLADMPSLADLESYVAQVEADVSNLCELDRSAFNVALYKRQKALKK